MTKQETNRQATQYWPEVRTEQPRESIRQSSEWWQDVLNWLQLFRGNRVLQNSRISGMLGMCSRAVNGFSPFGQSHMSLCMCSMIIIGQNVQLELNAVWRSCHCKSFRRHIVYLNSRLMAMRILGVTAVIIQLYRTENMKLIWK